ncbi:hypothetical protein ACFXTH_000952 [Malus domestica]
MSSGGSSSSSMTTAEGDEVHVNVILLPGFKFCPTDELLVCYYLKNKIQGTDSHFRSVIPEIDVSKYEPWDIPAFFPEVHEKEWFFFSRPKYKDINKPRRNRTTYKGFYKSTGGEREIRAEESQAVIGKKRFLTFHEGRARGPKATKTDWVIHEFTETEVGSFVLCLLKKRSPSYKKPKGDPICGKLADSGANSEDNQAAVSDVIPEPVEHLGYKGRGDVNSSEPPDGSRLIDSNNILRFDDGDDETGDVKFPDLDDPAASARFLELRAEMEEILNSPPQTPHQTPQDYLSSTFLSSGNIQLGAVLQANGTSDDCEPHSFTVFDFENKVADDKSQEPCVRPEKYLGSVLHADICDNGSNNWQPTCWDKDSYLTDKKVISTNNMDKQYSSIASNFDNQSTNKRKR